MSEVTPLGAVGRGLGAGVAGAALMTAWQEASMRLRRDESDSGSQGQESGGEQPGAGQPDPWQQASTPAKVARRIIEGVFERPVPTERIGLLTNVMHWAYGTSWGAVYGLIQASSPGRPLGRGALFGTGVWAMSYITLVPMGLYQPPWKYSPTELAMDLSYHLAYGIGTGVGYSLLDRWSL